MMTIRNFKTALLIAAMMAPAVAFAQKGVTDGSRYGHGDDSIKCLQNISLYTEYVKTNNFADAYKPWKEVFTDAPLAQSGTYTNGAKILHWLIANAKDGAEQLAYAEELQALYEQRIKYLDQLNKIVKNPTSEAEIRGTQAHDYISYNPKVDVDKAYTLLRNAVNMSKGDAAYYVLGDLMKISNQKYKKDGDAHREDLLQDYLDCSNYINSVIAGIEDEKILEQARSTKDNIDAYFVNSGAADCESLQKIYGDKVEENKTNLEYLQKVVSVMGMLKCTSSDAYFAAAEYAHEISPSSETAKSIGFMYLSKRDDYEKAMEYFTQAIDLEQDAFKKADLYYTAAVIMSQQKKYTNAKSYLQKSIQANPNDGNPYILLAQLYAGNHKWCDETALNQCTFYVVIDKLQQAKRVDPSVTDKANELIRTYSEYTPKIEDLFMLNLKKGDTVEVKGWINETTTIR